MLECPVREDVEGCHQTLVLELRIVTESNGVGRWMVHGVGLVPDARGPPFPESQFEVCRHFHT